jgi:hypothetical protein
MSWTKEMYEERDRIGGELVARALAEIPLLADQIASRLSIDLHTLESWISAPHRVPLMARRHVAKLLVTSNHRSWRRLLLASSASRDREIGLLARLLKASTMELLEHELSVLTEFKGADPALETILREYILSGRVKSPSTPAEPYLSAMMSRVVTPIVTQTRLAVAATRAPSLVVFEQTPGAT